VCLLLLLLLLRFVSILALPLAFLSFPPFATLRYITLRYVTHASPGHKLDDVHQKVENVRLLNGLSNVFLLEGSSLVELRVVPAPNAQVQDKEFAGLGKEDGSLRGDHSHVLVGLHDALDACQWQVVVRLEILFGLSLEFLYRGELLLPELVEASVELCKELGTGRGGCRGRRNEVVVHRRESLVSNDSRSRRSVGDRRGKTGHHRLTGCGEALRSHDRIWYACGCGFDHRGGRSGSGRGGFLGALVALVDSGRDLCLCVCVYQRLGLQLDLCLDLLGCSLGFPGVDNGLRLDLTEGVDLALIHGNKAIAPGLGSSHHSLGLCCGLHHGLRLGLYLFGSNVRLLAAGRRRLQLLLQLLL